MKKILQILALLICLGGGICGIVALCIKEPRQIGDFDYLGLLVGILALLVTVVITWQIYTLIDTQKLRKDYEDLNGKLESKYSALDKKLQNNLNIISAKRYYDQGMMMGGFNPASGIPYMLTAIGEILEAIENPEGKEFYDIILGHLKDFIKDSKSMSEIIDNWEILNKEMLNNVFELVIKIKDQELIEWYYNLQKEFDKRSP
ncbi:MAG: hypothetical protein J1F67_04990 [Muribaculaceae bacterium]|nr:hypothetical protein [Muribaculaceae bacterium]